MNRRVRFCLVLIAMAAWPGAPALAAKAEFLRPPYAGQYDPQGNDERGLWMELDEEERVVRDSPSIIRDGPLGVWIKKVLCEVVGTDRCGSVRIYVVRDASFNASMAPNGLMLVNTGLLARLHSEAELGAILGHEFAHFELRHSLAAFRSRRQAGDAIAWISLAGAAGGYGTGSISSAVVGALYRFNRSQETEADVLSAKFIQASPFRLRAAEVWGRVIAEDDAQRADQGRRKIRQTVVGFSDTHPTNIQRLQTFAKLQQDASTEGKDGIGEYKTATAQILPELFNALVKGNQFGSADYIIRSRGEALGWDASLLCLHAELYRQRANPRDMATARELYQRATMLPDAPAESWRGLGLSALRLGDPQTGRAALAHYLELAPKAPDAATIKPLLEN